MPRKPSLGNVRVALSPRERFEEYLQSSNKRCTQQRRMLVEHVFSHHHHFDADTLLDELSLLGRDAPSRPTVYRTLNELVDAGLLHRFQLDGRAVYEHDYGYPQHDHLYCVECRRLFEFRSDDLIALRDAVARKQNFRVASHRLIISGVCESCGRRKKRRGASRNRA